MRIGCCGGVDVEALIQQPLKHAACLARLNVQHQVSKAPTCGTCLLRPSPELASQCMMCCCVGTVVCDACTYR